MLNKNQLDAIDHAIETHLIAAGVDHVIYMDMGGNTFAKHDNGKTRLDSTAFAALAAGNYATVDDMAKLVGESEFSLLFHRGEKLSIHFSKVTGDTLLVSMLGIFAQRPKKYILKINRDFQLRCSHP